MLKSILSQKNKEGIYKILLLDNTIGIQLHIHVEEENNESNLTPVYTNQNQKKETYINRHLRKCLAMQAKKKLFPTNLKQKTEQVVLNLTNILASQDSPMTLLHLLHESSLYQR